MREQEAAPSRRRRKSPPKEKAKARKFDIKEIFGELRTAFKIFNIVAALVTLYVIASLYTPWTGDAGAATAGWLLSNIGGAVIIPLLFLLYTEIKLILASPIERLAAPSLRHVLYIHLPFHDARPQQADGRGARACAAVRRGWEVRLRNELRDIQIHGDTRHRPRGTSDDISNAYGLQHPSAVFYKTAQHFAPELQPAEIRPPRKRRRRTGGI